MISLTTNGNDSWAGYPDYIKQRRNHTRVLISKMDTGVSSDVHEHGVVVNRKKGRVKCNYCDKEVSGFSRLKCHLGGVRGDVVPCEEVPEHVKVVMRNSVLERKKEMLSKETLHLFESDIPSNINSCSSSTDNSYTDNHLGSVEHTVSRKRKHMAASSIVKEDEKQQVLFPHRKVDSHYAPGSENDLSKHVQRCIGKFFFENGIDFSAVDSHSFQKMMCAVTECGPKGYNAPNCYDLKGWILQEEIKEIHHYVQEVRHSWVNTGCSILLDGWRDEKGRTLINFLVDCPRGPMFLRCADISDSIEDINALISLLGEVIEDVGVKNVVQIVTYKKLDCMEAMSKHLSDVHRTIFWTVCASHCIGLMLENIGMILHIHELIGQAMTITKFLYSHSDVLKLLRKHIHGRDLIYPSRIKSAMPFLTLENIVFERENLESMFASSSWNTSIWASRTDGRAVAELVGSLTFWTEAAMCLKATIPLIRALHLINGGDINPQVGYIYETMDQAKETIKEEYKGKKSKYMPFWKIIDEIWDNFLHSPLHSAGYFLNPGLFYSSDFYADAEVASGLLCCIVRMFEDQRIQDLVVLQLDEYRMAKGSFGEQTALDQRTTISPAKWWSLYGGQCPELQRFAIRILSQTCNGALKYGLKRSLSEQLLMKGRNSIEQQRLNELTFVQHNLRLLHSLSSTRKDFNEVFLDEIDPMDDWVVEAVGEVRQNDGSRGMMDCGCGTPKLGGCSKFQPKIETMD